MGSNNKNTQLILKIWDQISRTHQDVWNIWDQISRKQYVFKDLRSNTKKTKWFLRFESKHQENNMMFKDLRSNIKKTQLFLQIGDQIARKQHVF